MKTLKTLLITIAVLLCSATVSAYDFEVDGIYYNITSAAERTVEVTDPEMKDEYSMYIPYYKGYIDIPSTVTYNDIEFKVVAIGQNAFTPSDTPNPLLLSVSIPEGVTSIGGWAFCQCNNLKTVKFPQSLKVIERYAFAYCENLEGVDIPENLTRIGDSAFNGCKNLIYVRFAPNVSSKGDYPFPENLKVAWLPKEGMGIDAVNLFQSSVKCFVAYGIHYIMDDGSPFYNDDIYTQNYWSNVMMYDSTLTDVEITTLLETGAETTLNGVKYSVTALNGTFEMEVCGYESGITTANIVSKLTYLNREFTVTSIKASAFANATSLTTVKIPSSIKSIGSNAFSGCTAITNVTTEAETPLAINDGCFHAMAQLFGTLYVPTSSLDAYKAANVWKGFGNIVGSGVSYKTLTLKADEGGSIACGNTSVCGGTEYASVVSGETTITVTPKSNYVIKSVTVDGADITSQLVDGVLSLTVSADTRIEATFRMVDAASYDFEKDGIYYTFITGKDGVVYVAKGDKAYSGELVIPESVTYNGIEYKVEGIKSWIFKDNIGITSITIPSGIKKFNVLLYELGNSTNLSSITFSDPNAIESVNLFNQLTFKESAWYKNQPDGPLYLCNWLVGYKGEMPANTRLEIEEGTVGIADYAFSDSINLTSVVIPNTVKRIGDGAFGGTGLTSIELPSSLTYLGRYAFNGCENLSSVTLPTTNTLTEIGYGAFRGTAWYNNQVDGLVYLSNWLYGYKGEVSSNLSITISEGTVGIAGEAFKGLGSYLTSVSMPSTLKYIGEAAFYDCSSLTSVTIGNSVKSIGSYAFFQCSNLSQCNIESLDAWCLIDFEDRYANPLSANYEVGLYLNGNLLENITIPNTITEIKSHAFIGTKILSITIPNSVTSINAFAFSYCVRVSSIEIPSSVTSIGFQAFAGMPIGAVTLPKSTTVLYGNPFAGCPAITSITVEDGNPAYDSRNNCNAIIHTAANTLVTGCSSTIIPNSVTSIGDLAFMEDQLITTVNIPGSVESIGKDCFTNCNNLTSVSIQDGVKLIDYQAFSNCTQLGVITIPESVELIGKNAFYSSFSSVLTLVTCKAQIPPTLLEYAWGSRKLNAILYVPFTALNAYQEAEGWDYFASIEAISSEILISDTQESYELESALPFEKLTYTRTLNNLYWNALYVPFEIPVSQLIEDYDIAYINAMHSYDMDDNGAIDSMVMEVVKIKEGTLHANYPYLIRAKNEEAKAMEIVVEKSTLYAAESVTVDCSSVFTKFEITGTYQPLTNEEIDGCYALSDGTWKTMKDDATLNPFRLYLRISDREGSPVKVDTYALEQTSVTIRVQGENPGTTSIESKEIGVKSEESDATIYNLMGQPVKNPVKGSIYIQGGRKVVW